mmetsp:Transcript_30323/g.63736  ORF Transcript_30323/g.63736 Transcript_30323/m.63736 type:complete len:110 (-) Transcript_30323:1141-1470(-)
MTVISAVCSLLSSLRMDELLMVTPSCRGQIKAADYAVPDAFGDGGFHSSGSASRIALPSAPPLKAALVSEHSMACKNIFCFEEELAVARAVESQHINFSDVAKEAQRLA